MVHNGSTWPMNNRAKIAGNRAENPLSRLARSAVREFYERVSRVSDAFYVCLNLLKNSKKKSFKLPKPLTLEVKPTNKLLYS